MTLVFTELCNGPNGDPLTPAPGNTAFESITGSGTSVFSNAEFVEGESSILVSQQRQCHAGLSGGLFFRSSYMMLVNLPTTTYDFSLALFSGGIRARLRWNTSGEFRLLDGGTVVGTGSHTVLAGQWYRIEWTIDSVGGTQSFEAFTGADLHTQTPIESLSGAYTTSDVDQMTFGRQASVGTDTYIDRILIDDAVMPAPFQPPTGETVTLDGVLPSLQGSFDVASSAEVALSGQLPALEGSFNIASGVAVSFDGTLPTLQGSFDVAASSDVALAGGLPALEGSFLILEADVVDVQLDGVLPGLQGSFTIDVEVVVAGRPIQPSAQARPLQTQASLRPVQQQIG